MYKTPDARSDAYIRSRIGPIGQDRQRSGNGEGVVYVAVY
jgi:hypothetical protein